MILAGLSFNCFGLPVSANASMCMSGFCVASWRGLLASLPVLFLRRLPTIWLAGISYVKAPSAFKSSPLA